MELETGPGLICLVTILRRRPMAQFISGRCNPSVTIIVFKYGGGRCARGINQEFCATLLIFARGQQWNLNERRQLKRDRTTQRNLSCEERFTSAGWKTFLRVARNTWGICSCLSSCCVSVFWIVQNLFGMTAITVACNTVLLYSTVLLLQYAVCARPLGGMCCVSI